MLRVTCRVSWGCRRINREKKKVIQETPSLTLRVRNWTALDARARSSAARLWSGRVEMLQSTIRGMSDSPALDKATDPLPPVFVSHACDILADTNLGLSGTKIVKVTAAYSVETTAIDPGPRRWRSPETSRRLIRDSRAVPGETCARRKALHCRVRLPAQSCGVAVQLFGKRPAGHISDSLLSAIDPNSLSTSRRNILSAVRASCRKLAVSLVISPSTVAITLAVGWSVGSAAGRRSSARRRFMAANSFRLRSYSSSPWDGSSSAYLTRQAGSGFGSAGGRVVFDSTSATFAAGLDRVVFFLGV
jgi:hypothetical protein